MMQNREEQNGRIASQPRERRWALIMFFLPEGDIECKPTYRLSRSHPPCLSLRSSDMPIKILALSGGSRRNSLNQKLLEVAVLGARAVGADVSMIGLSDLRLPIYDGDWEQENGFPEGALKFKSLIAAHHAFLIATPEYNGAYTALLKNALDWASRPTGNDPSGLRDFAGKLAAMVSASPGPLGGIRSQIALQVLLRHLGVLVVPTSFALSAAHQAFDERGGMKDSNAEKAVRGVGAALAEVTAQFAGPRAMAAS
jgi:NAD(P)H-dependent FMN reductase